MIKKRTLPAPESTYRAKITYTCPVRGVVTQEVEVKRYGAVHVEPIFDEELTTFLTQEGVLEETLSLAELPEYAF
jgi:hypothetical protein